MSPNNQILHGDCVDGMARLPEACIPLATTSPPYDQMFNFGGHLFDFEKFKLVAAQLWRILMVGGVLCWEIKDQYRNGFSGTKYRQVVHFQELGFRLHDELFIKNAGITHHSTRHPEQVHMLYVLSKGKPRTYHPIEDRLNKTAGDKQKLYRRYADGRKRVWKSPTGVVPVWGLRTHLWEILSGYKHTAQDDLEGFPAPMAESLASDLIATYSNFGDLVFDPFSGIGTTAKMALLGHRDYLGFEIHKPYYEQSLRRLKRYNRKLWMRT
jgi:DNA modification methylase